jgi:hypothetical protein
MDIFKFTPGAIEHVSIFMLTAAKPAPGSRPRYGALSLPLEDAR